MLVATPAPVGRRSTSQTQLSVGFSRDRRARVDYESHSPVARFAPDREALSVLSQQRGSFDRGRRPLVFLHRACRRRRDRWPLRRDLGSLHRALPRRSGAPWPSCLERGPDREGAERNRLRHRLRRLDRQEDEPRAARARARRLRRRLCAARIHHRFRFPAAHRRLPIAIGAAAFSQSIALVRRQFEGRKPAHRQSRHRRSSRELVAGLGHRACDRRLDRCGGRLSRRLSRKRRFRRDRARDARPGASEADFAPRPPTPAGANREWRSGDRARFRGARACSTPRCSWARSRFPSC